MKLHDTKKSAYKNPWYLHTLKINYPKKKLKINPIYNSYIKNKILRNKLNHKDERLIHTVNYKTLIKEVKEDTDKKIFQ